MTACPPPPGWQGYNNNTNYCSPDMAEVARYNQGILPPFRGHQPVMPDSWDKLTVRHHPGSILSSFCARTELCVLSTLARSLPISRARFAVVRSLIMGHSLIMNRRFSTGAPYKSHSLARRLSTQYKSRAVTPMDIPPMGALDQSIPSCFCSSLLCPGQIQK